MAGVKGGKDIIDALNEVRHEGEPLTLAPSFCPRAKLQDLSSGWEHGGLPVVFRLFGGATTSSPEYAVTEEDILEFVCRLQDEHARPNELFDTDLEFVYSNDNWRPWQQGVDGGSASLIRRRLLPTVRAGRWRMVPTWIGATACWVARCGTRAG